MYVLSLVGCTPNYLAYFIDMFQPCSDSNKEKHCLWWYRNQNTFQEWTVIHIVHQMI